MADTQLIRCPTCGATNRVPLEKIKPGAATRMRTLQNASATADNKPVT